MDRCLDTKGRWRNVVVAFRMSNEESKELNTRVRLSGLTKQDYLIRRMLEKDIVVVGNPRVYKALRNEMKNIFDELKRIKAGCQISDELLEIIQVINVTMKGLNE